MRLNNWQASDRPQQKSRKTPKAVRRHRRKLARLAQRLRQGR